MESIKRDFGLIILLIIMTVTSHSKEFTDMAGREVEIPEKVERVYSVNPNGDILMYTIAPEKLVGWSIKLSEKRKKYIENEYKKLPVLGVMYGNSSKANSETVLGLNIDLIISLTPYFNKSAINNADMVQKKLGIPVILLDGKLDKLDETYEIIGEILDREDKAKELGDYCKNTYESVKKIKTDKKRKVYYARGKNGLTTELGKSKHMEIVKLVGGVNVIESIDKTDLTTSKVSFEKILMADPDIIITGSNAGSTSNLSEYIKSKSLWKSLRAVKNKRVYNIPQEPFNWFDRPPSVNRVIGIRWMEKLLYPQYYDFNIKDEVKKFYKLFYRYDLNDEDINELIGKNM